MYVYLYIYVYVHVCIQEEYNYKFHALFCVVPVLSFVTLRLQCVAVCCSVLQRVAACCSVLQCMLQCVALTVCCLFFTSLFSKNNNKKQIHSYAISRIYKYTNTEKEIS